MGFDKWNSSTGLWFDKNTDIVDIQIKTYEYPKVEISCSILISSNAKDKTELKKKIEK